MRIVSASPRFEGLSTPSLNGANVYGLPAFAVLLIDVLIEGKRASQTRGEQMSSGQVNDYFRPERGVLALSRGLMRVIVKTVAVLWAKI
jgi:hypothetical protein